MAIEYPIFLANGNIRRIGAIPVAIGHYADVFEGEVAHGGDVTKVAIKDLRGGPSTERNRRAFQESIRRAAREWQKLSHRNVARFLGLSFQSVPIVSLVSPYFAHGTVLSFIKNHPSSNRIKIIADVYAGLAYLHSNRPPIIHGDLKGSNILIQDDGTACLADYGLIDLTSSSEITRSSITGACRYQAPEVLMFDVPNVSPFTLPSDVFSLGMTSLEIITEKPPFSQRRYDTQVIFDIIEGRLPSKPSGNSNADVLWDILQDCWERDPRSRPAAREVYSRVQDLLS